jgi:hypothetical protein
MKGLVDRAVVIIAMIVPPLFFQEFKKACHCHPCSPVDPERPPSAGFEREPANRGTKQALHPLRAETRDGLMTVAKSKSFPPNLSGAPSGWSTLCHRQQEVKAP